MIPTDEDETKLLRRDLSELVERSDERLFGKFDDLAQRAGIDDAGMLRALGLLGESDLQEKYENWLDGTDS